MPTDAQRAYWRARYQQRRFANLEAGLTTHGTPWKRTPPLLERNKPAHYRRLNLAKYHRRAQRRIAAGLTTRGTPRKYALIGHPVRETELAWRALRSEFVIPETVDYLAFTERDET